ncbi:MAG: hypothetical protein AB1393_14195 [Candidatus Edwardsbacteria bacterium]
MSHPLNILLSPPVSFVIFLLMACFLYWLGGLLAPNLREVGGKLKQYACGEDVPAQKLQFNYRLFFYVALFFTMMHVAALVIATLPSGRIAFLGIFYLVMISLSVAALIVRK